MAALRAVMIVVLGGASLSAAQTPAATAAPTGTQTAAQTGTATTVQQGTSTGVQQGIQQSAGVGGRTGTSAPSGASLPGSHVFLPMPMPQLSPGAMELLKLEDQFAQDVAKGGGRAFASWFAPDGVTLNNGKAAVQGQSAIAAMATWDPKSYQLQWYVEGAQMAPSGESGWTWGHYETHATDAAGKVTGTSGRYITFWEKVKGAWKVALDASADDAPGATAASPK